MSADHMNRERYFCEAGWHPIVDRFVAAGRQHAGFELYRAGEKWGVLDLAWEADDGRPEALRAAEKIAFEESTRTCEICGKEGSLRMFHWRKTLCDQHAVDRLLRLSVSDIDEFQARYSAERDRWTSAIATWQHEGKSADEIYERFMSAFYDIENPSERRFWAVNCTRQVLLLRAEDEGRSREEGI
ncbi:hypothetical protein HFO91_30330 [Rhizobium leguminosarum]|uniref:hypothetical protein n=1 Tax=Rhizobium leguminosarum TaxID=384 RepID=UPI001C94E349|nr:hypothetical protein [Rhizobium leguminosarum]MBY5453877.1 hypothetical protein [Rhizobium leguminosarum]